MKTILSAVLLEIVFASATLQGETYVLAQCQAQGCRYVETSFHLPAVSWIDTDGPELLDAILEAAPPDLEVRVFGGMTHTDYAQHGELLERAVASGKFCSQCSLRRARRGPGAPSHAATFCFL